MIKEDCARNVPTKRLYSVKELAKEIGATEWYWRTQIWNPDRERFEKQGTSQDINSNVNI